ncbi:fimbrial protein [Photorhabdus temperata]|uniref:Pilin n=1 Tax=Photorhabdus temperata J3 TaxID=1389415 RepID=U7QTD2_PHOTE|nr:fimbrial protein [Photorhabdus temperata]EQC01646.1 fimbrial regulatory protein papH [Photorhabdus temperata subsp. temperata M1021]ERT11123.1 pilin [Photorhabdus temperata J3]
MSRYSAVVVVPCLLMFSCIAVGAEATATRGTQGHGRVSMQGAIIDTACAIDAGSRDQTIELATIPVSRIVHDGQGPVRPFSIRLINCVLTSVTLGKPDWRHFQMTFDGVPDGNNFRLDGAARGVALQITDTLGNQAYPGTPLPVGDLQEGHMTLSYMMRLVGNHPLLQVGQYRTTVRFRLDYH